MALTGSCHCGAIAFELDLAGGDAPTDAYDCNCSLCRRRGALLAFFAADALTLTTDAAALATYRFHTQRLAHRFCRVCGIAPYSEGEDPASGRRQVAVNLRCLDGLDLATLRIVPVDGASL
jgi:hypothetical protein